MSCDLTWLLLKPGRTIRSQAEKDRPPEWYRASTHCVLVETSEGRMLWDTSCPRDWASRWEPTGLQEFFPYDQVGEDEYFDSRLRQQGLEPSDIDYVVLSHLHFDHAGNAKLFDGTDAKMVCSKEEYDFAFGFDGLFTGAHLKSDYDGLKWDTVDGDSEFLPGVSLIQAPGHTPGTTAMRVDLPDTGTMIFTSDAVFMGDTYGPPAAGATLVNDLTAFYRSVEKIRKLAEETNATLVFGHDSQQLAKLRVAPESYT
jgi:glyoxylase-like metal-dependent hydrolase (beta-lactamase superfamily II)